ncbi:DUF4097 family beta strand repeat-containing protein [Streptomyces sp. NRRL WC-3549]|uniref:DUF4097 family beta strand repeat-containing protein n=1 Tax=Streptomyces sp. NRRL WC-3549 TaxID=1463925 RepID=UPI0004C7D488|nr:DUF4097 family beta strand repeat-containing protein [Streptomyces sp. NRRL WC-3549]
MKLVALPEARRPAALLAVALLVTACGPAPRHEAGEHTGTPPSLAGGAHLLVTTDNGARLRPAESDRAALDPEITGRWSHHGDDWVLDLSCPEESDQGGRECPRMPVVQVPARLAVTVRARNAGIDVADVAAALDLTTVNGDVTVVRAGLPDADLRLTTRNGSVHADAVDSARLDAGTVNGDVTLTGGSPPARLVATTTNGSVRVVLPEDAPAYRTEATTRNGRTSVTVPAPASGERARYGMTLTTVNGDVDAVRGRLPTGHRTTSDPR